LSASHTLLLLLLLACLGAQETIFAAWFRRKPLIFEVRALLPM